ncbi:MAG: TasA family protein [Candidatus Dojkabacteria bacterium]
MKKLLFSFVVLGITSVLAIGATTAYFSDTEVSSANTFTAGTLDLQVDNQNTTVKSFIVEGMKPGDSYGRKYFRLKNTGSISGVPKICLTSVQNIESAGITEFENDGAPGELGANMELIVDTNGHWLMTSGQKFNSFIDRCWTPTNPADAEFAASGSDVLDPNEEMIFGIALNLPISTGNLIQGDSLLFDLEFTLEQE